ncbi:MAG TPA: hypothetical protein VFA07_03375 [Chthonomonadaceae bacterium]|nr:hypothetical protein [Chthonomonadaceae bacterium]
MTSFSELERNAPGDWFYDVHDQLKQHIYRRSERAFAAGDAARDAITTRGALEARQQAIREHFLAALGGLPPSELSLEARTVGTVEGEGFHIEKIIFQSRPHHYVTANLYLPDGLREPRGAVLFLCGHHPLAKHTPQYQSVCQILTRAGLIVLAQDPIGQGERLSYYEPSLKVETIDACTIDHDYAGAQCLPLGDSLARYFLHDAMRGIDYLQSRPEVDGRRIGVTGSSGGGTQTCLMMLAEPRIAAAAPATFLMSRESYLAAGGAQDAEQIWRGFTAHGFDHEDILIAMTPRPVCALAVTGDFFPIEGTRRTVARCKRFWEMAGKEDDLELVEDISTHAYTPTLARAAAQFFARHLLGTQPDPETLTFAPFEPSRLWCTASGQVRAEFPDAAFVHETNVERLREREQQRRAIPDEERRERALQWLREKVQKDRRPCDLNPRFYSETRIEELKVASCLWWSQEGLFGHGRLFRSFQHDGKRLPVTLAVWDGGTSRLHDHGNWIRQTCEAGRAVLVLDVSGVGGLRPRSLTLQAPEDFYGVIHKFSTDLLWLNDDLVSLRTYDVLRALDMIGQWPNLNADDIRLYAHGRHGLYGQLAAALDNRIHQIEVVDGMESFAAWIASRHYDTHDIYSVILPGALHYFDLPELGPSAGLT